MPWKEMKTIDQRIRFIKDYLDKLFSISELCRRYGICRVTGYKWIKRYEASSMPDALSDLLRRTKPSAFKT